MPDALSNVTLGQVGVVIGLIVLIVGAVSKAWPWLSRLKNTLDDWMGEPPRPGVEARPGLMERQADTEAREAARDIREAERDAAVELLRPVIAEISAKVDRIDYHSQPNGGGSAHDAILREVAGVRDEVAAARTELAEHVKQAAEIHDEQAAAIAYLADGATAVATDLADAIGPAIRSTPHECDVPHDPPHDDTPGP